MATTTRPGTRTHVANPADVPRGTLVELLFEAVEKLDRPEAFRHKVNDTWRSVSHRTFLEDVRRLALALEKLGMRRGDRLALLSETRLAWALADYATLCIGAQDIPVYPNLPADQVAYIVRDSAARLLFVSTAEQLAKVRGVWDDLPLLERVIVFDDVTTEDDERVLTLAQALERGEAEVEAGKGEGFRERALAAQPDDIATILYTSGTTARPKGVLLTHNNICSNTKACRAVLSGGGDEIALALLPLSHIFERMAEYRLLAIGCVIAYAESIEKVPENLLEVRPTIVVSVPRLYEKIHGRIMAASGLKAYLVRWAKRVGERWANARLAGETPPLGTRIQHALADRLVFRKLRAATGGRIRFFIAGGAPLNPEIARFFYSAGLLILEGYGLTETSPVTNVNTPDEFRFGTVGKPIPGTEEMIASDGEILVRGPQIMHGYHNDPEGTHAAIDQHGWFHTGDLGAIDEDGFLRITDRKKDLIVTAGGKNIAPQPIENRVRLNRFVTEAVMIGDRRPYPVLLVVPDFDALDAWAGVEGVQVANPRALLEDERVQRKMEEEIFRELEGLARYETPKKVALLEEEFTIEKGELTPSLKVRRRVVEDKYRDRIEGLYTEAAQMSSDSAA